MTWSRCLKALHSRSMKVFWEKEWETGVLLLLLDCSFLLALASLAQARTTSLLYACCAQLLPCFLAFDRVCVDDCGQVGRDDKVHMHDRRMGGHVLRFARSRAICYPMLYVHRSWCAKGASSLSNTRALRDFGWSGLAWMVAAGGWVV